MLTDTKTLVEMDPNSRSAKDVARLEKLQAEKSEKMKEEAIGEPFMIKSAVDTVTKHNVVVLLVASPCGETGCGKHVSICACDKSRLLCVMFCLGRRRF